tara:strand:- start:25103 stop:25669 length:567 start_codon:yes stop_codon:yes gene_type:complete
MRSTLVMGLSLLGSLLLLSGCASTSGGGTNYAANTTVEKKRSVDPMELRSYRFPQTREANGRNTFIFDPKHLMWGAYDANGQLVNQGAASGGKGYCADIGRSCRTPSGSYAVYRKGGAGCKSTKYPVGKGGAPMPYCMFFNGGYAVHGSPHVPGYNASHGCIRVPPSDAAWLSQNFMSNGTKVIVKSY